MIVRTRVSGKIGQVGIAALLLLIAAGATHAHPGTLPPLPADRVDLLDLAQVKIQVGRLKAMHRYRDAEQLMRDSVGVVEQEYGRRSEQAFDAYLILLKTLKTTDRGALDDRRTLALRTIDTAERVFGSESFEKYSAQVLLEGVLTDAGELDAAYESATTRIVAMERLLASGDPRLAKALLTYSVLLTEIGRRDEARRYLDRSLDLLQLSGSLNSMPLARALRVRGRMAREDGDVELALRLFERALSTGGTEHFESTSRRRGLVLNELALLRSMQGDYVEARRLSNEALRLHEWKYGEDDACLLAVLQANARILFLAGDEVESIKAYERALTLLDDEKRDKFWKRRNTQLLDGLARVQWSAGNHGEALGHALAGHQLARERFVALIQGLPERMALLQEARFGSGLDTALSIYAGLSADARKGKTTQKVWDEVMRSRAIVLDEIASRNRVSGMARSGERPKQVLAFQRASTRLAHLVQIGPENGVGAERVLAAIRERDKAEASLAKSGDSGKARLVARHAGVAEVLESLPPDSRLVSFVHFNRTFSPTGSETEPYYVAIVGRPDGHLSRMVEIGPGNVIDPLIDDWRRLVGRDPRLDAAASIDELRSCGAELRKRVWDPLAPELVGVRTVFVILDGALNLVNLETLPIGDDRYLIETAPVIHLLSAERDLVRFRRDARAPTAGLLAVGAPDFEMASAIVDNDRESSNPASAHRGLASECPSFRLRRFTAIPATLSEVESIVNVWKSGSLRAERGEPTKTLVGAAASEERFKRLAPMYGTIHIATHGFFVPERCEPRGEIGGLTSNPLLYSGLALAGANRRMETDSDDEDGMLTAAEIASLDLSNVDWAVLSACETGVGDVRSGEGVLGLRRAFEVAGARTLIMSLWKVEDDATAMWMEHLYGARATGASTIEAVRRADLQILNLLRERGRTPHPFFWGAFVAVGDWR